MRMVYLMIKKAEKNNYFLTIDADASAGIHVTDCRSGLCDQSIVIALFVLQNHKLKKITVISHIARLFL